MIKQTVITATLFATCLLSVSPVWAQDTIPQMNSSKTGVSHVSDKAHSSTKAKKSKLSLENLDEKSKETIKTVGEVMPAINDYRILNISKELQNSRKGTIEVYEIMMSGEPKGDDPNFARLRLDAATGQLIIAETQNGLPSITPLDDTAAEKKANEYLQKLLAGEAENYKFTSVHTNILGENRDKPVTLVTYYSLDDEVYISLDGNGELKRFLKNIYPSEE